MHIRLYEDRRKVVLCVVNEAVSREVRQIEADVSTFEVLKDREYAKDKHHA